MLANKENQKDRVTYLKKVPHLQCSPGKKILQCIDRTNLTNQPYGNYINCKKMKKNEIMEENNNKVKTLNKTIKTVI